MTPIIITLSITGAIAVLGALTWAVIGLAAGWQTPGAKAARVVFLIFAAISAVIGVLIAFVPGINGGA